MNENELKKILFWLLDEKHNLDSGVCDNITGRPDKDYLLGLNKIVNKCAGNIISKLPNKWEVIASGEVKAEISELNIYFIKGKQVNSMFKKYKGKNVEIAVRRLTKTHKKD